MARLPQPGGDKGNWGNILNDYLSAAHNPDGSLKDIPQAKITNLVADLAAKATPTQITSAIQAQATTDAATYATQASVTSGLATKASPADVDAKIAAQAVVDVGQFARTTKLRRRISASNSAMYATNGGGFILSGTNLYQHARLSQRTLKPGRNLKMSFITVNSNGETGLGGDGSNITIRASAEYPAGTFYPAYTSGGLRDVVVTPGGGIGKLEVPGFEVPGGNAEWWIRYRVVGTAGGAIPYTVRPNRSTEWAIGPTSNANDYTVTNSGAPTPGTNLPGYSGAPSSVTYEPYDTTTPCVVLVGDSITQGQGDDAQAVAYFTSNPGGWAIQALSGDGVTGRAVAGVSNLNLTCSAEMGNVWVTGGAKTRTALLDDLDATTAWFMYTNDIANAVATAQADFLAVWTMLANRGIRVVVFTIPPRSNSTDNWASVANQSGTSPNRVVLNQWMRAGAPIHPTTKAAVAMGTAGALLAGSAGHPAAQVVDVCSAVENTQDSGKWKVTGSAYGYTVDGVHPSAAGHAAMAAVAYAQAVPTIV